MRESGGSIESGREGSPDLARSLVVERKKSERRWRVD